MEQHEKCMDIVIDEINARNTRRRKRSGNRTEDIEIRGRCGPLHADRVNSLKNVQGDRS